MLLRRWFGAHEKKQQVEQAKFSLTQAELEKFSPPIQYFIAKINKSGNLDALQAKALAYIKTIDHDTCDDADKYFFHVQSDINMEMNVAMGGSGGCTGMSGQLLKFDEAMALSYVEGLLANNSVAFRK